MATFISLGIVAIYWPRRVIGQMLPAAVIRPSRGIVDAAFKAEMGQLED
jgi:hypothetical protein